MTANRLLPNLILAGAPKCGTSSLYRWLVDHPDVAAGHDKELFYLVDRDSPFRNSEANIHDHGLEGYGRLFQNADTACRWRLDGTTHTLYQRSAIEVLRHLPEIPQVIVVLRRPADRVFSSFRFSQHTLARFSRPISFSDFRHLLEQRDEAALRRLVPFARSRYVLQRDVAYSQYIDWLLPWRHALGEHLHIVLLENLKASPAETVRPLAATLELAPSFYDGYDFPLSNRTLRPRHPALHRLLRRLRPWIPKGRLSLALYGHYLRRNSEPLAAPTAQDLDALETLDRHFASYDQRLAEAFDLDLSRWRRRRGGAPR